MPKEVDLQLTVNGKLVQARVPDDLTLLHLLRNQMGLLGTKEGCGEGHCGVCTVLLNGRPQKSCLLTAAEASGGTVETIESLERPDGKLHPLQAAFVLENAVQCGFCSPAMILASKALLDENPQPDEAQIRHALKDNYCRCTGYSSIVRSVQRAAALLAAGNSAVELPENPSNGDGLMGKSIINRQSVEAVTGKTRYGADRAREGMLYGKIYWADYPSARILAIDTDAALAEPGVALVLTGKDVPGTNKVGMLRRDQPGIALDRVKAICDIVAVVFAESEEAAARGLSKLRVHYEPLPGVFSPQEAAARGAPLVQPEGNLLHSAFLKRGDVEAAFASAAAVAEGSFQTPFIEHAFLEPESGLAYPDGSGGVVLEIGTQCPFDDRIQLSEALGLPQEKIRVRQVPMGGAFGGKEDILLHLALTLGALRSNRPVKITLTRPESLRGHPKRHPAWMHYKLAADAEGHFVAVQAEIDVDTGAYASLGADILENMLTFGAGPYYVPAVDLNARAWYTNNLPAGAMRGFGVPQVTFALEALIDELGRKLGLDPFEIRLRNALDVGLPLASDHVLEASVGIKGTLTAARDALQKLELPGDGQKIGIGVASSLKNIGFGHGITEDAGAEVELQPDGRLVVRVGVSEFGQGAFTAFAQLAANDMSLPFDQVKVEYVDTGVSPETGATTASRQTFLSGNAVLNACQALKGKIFSLAEEELRLPASELCLQNGAIVHEPSGRAFPLRDLQMKILAAGRYVAPQTDPFTYQPTTFESGGLRSRRTHFTYGFGTHVAVVAVDEATGKVRVLKIIAAHDVGRAINPLVIEGQIEGGAIMGMGFGLSEEFVIENGYNCTDTLEKCGIPGMEDSPAIIPLIVEDPDPNGPHGVKGMGEVSILPTAAAVANAIYDAVGVRITSLPAKPEKVLAGLRQKGG
jgi:CO/xanthine dehydrogenase Mo-binding subunit/aerobic-type carbon monoxide dehydrogenase small subunit (CoxS/CutS family)